MTASTTTALPPEAPTTPPVNIVLALTTLWASQPGPNATLEQEAAWYTDKARTHEQIADLARTDDERAEHQSHAAAAAEHARALHIKAEAKRRQAEADAAREAEVSAS